MPASSSLASISSWMAPDLYSMVKLSLVGRGSPASMAALAEVDFLAAVAPDDVLEEFGAVLVGD